MTIEEICSNFDIKGQFISSEKISCGIINKTYKVVFYRDGENKVYTLQKINKNVFKEPLKIMENIVRVTEYIRQKIKATGVSAKRGVLHFQKTTNGDNCFIDNDGEYWRCYRYIEDSIVYNESNNLDIIKEVGRIFGEFQMYLSDFDAKSLYESIPDFHNTKKRYGSFRRAVSIDVAFRVKEVKDEIAFLESCYDEATKLIDLTSNGKIPIRVTHNDTKCNNVVFDTKTNKAIAVLDLDTVMPGLVAYDFGDAVRFIANSANEDEVDISKVSLDLEKYKALAKGFLSSVKHSLTENEIEYLSLGAFVMTIELAMRFLTDYINGDTYFHIDYKEHNLVRARCQIALAKDMILKKEQMLEIIKNC